MRALLLAAALALASVAVAPAADVYTLMAKRLAVMEDVAAWKHAAGKPIEDKEREAVVLDAAVKNAKAEGIEEAGARVFFRSMIEAAKDIQACEIARWEAGEATPPAEPKDLNAEIRPQLIILGRQILGAIRRSLEAGDALSDRAAFDTAMAIDCLSPARAEGMYDALGGLRFSG
ncbi:MAG: gamma subclass chorismate mutase AroQ [Pseudomonadota bacterium]